VAPRSDALKFFRRISGEDATSFVTSVGFRNAHASLTATGASARYEHREAGSLLSETRSDDWRWAAEAIQLRPEFRGGDCSERTDALSDDLMYFEEQAPFAAGHALRAGERNPELLRKVTCTAQALCKRATRDELKFTREFGCSLAPEKPFLGVRKEARQGFAGSRASFDLARFPGFEGKDVWRWPDAAIAAECDRCVSEPHRFGSLPRRHDNRLALFYGLQYIRR
jgi:hypothetical protein